MNQLDQLLEVQEHDTAVAQLIHKRASLPEREERATLQNELVSIAHESDSVGEKRHAVKLDQSRIEDEVGMVERKRISENEKLYSGAVTGAKELQGIQEEIASLKRRQTALEDQVIELMEVAEPIDAELAMLTQRQESATARLKDVEERLTIAEAEIDATLDVEQAEREQAAAAVDPALLERYAAIKDDMGGVGIARFVSGRCEGCHLTMSSVEADRVKKAPAGEILTCESCERILVR